ncbi:MAG TPA: hypothetical protein VFZ42_04775 [Chitinophagaceae bacterium]
MQKSKICTSLLRTACIAGPLLMLIGSLVFVLGIGVSPNNKSSYLEGIFGCYGIVLFIAVYWELSRRLAESNRVLAAITYITGLLGPAAGFTHMYGRIVEHELRLHGVSEQVWQSFYAHPGSELLSVALLGTLFPLTSIILGIGLLVAKKIPALMAGGLILAGILFPAAMISESDTLLHSAYPAACLIWLIVFSTYAIKFIPARRMYLNR